VATNVASLRRMTTSEASAEGRRRGGIRRHGQGWQARVSAGADPSTGERIVLYETVPIPEARTKSARERAEREAYKEAQKILTRLQPEADSLKVGRTKATVGTDDLTAAEDRLNHRPRKILGWRTPAEVFSSAPADY
jgi:Transposase and inactivated derivatives, IS30 family